MNKSLGLTLAILTALVAEFPNISRFHNSNESHVGFLGCKYIKHRSQPKLRRLREVNKNG